MTGTTLGIYDSVRLDKAATDAGFDVRQEAAGSWLPFASTSSPLRISLTVIESKPVAALSLDNVLEVLGVPSPGMTAFPADMAGGFSVSDFGQLQTTLARARELANALPNMLLRTWQSRVKSVASTERDAIVRQRIGQDLFRSGLIALWRGRCAVTGLAVPELLRASHAKPWRVSSDEERLDVYNGLLLVAHLDVAFDAGLIGFTSKGDLLLSPYLGPSELLILGLDRNWPALELRVQHLPYLAFHLEQVFRKE